MSTSEEKSGNWSLTAALAAAVTASACCTIPLTLIALGFGGAWIGTLTALEPFRPLFVTLAVGALAYAGYREWRLTRPPDCDCETRMSTTVRRTLLGVAVIAVVGLIASPSLIAVFGADEELTERAPLITEQVVLEVEGMTCALCNITVRKALSNLDGVQDAQVTFEPPEAVVTYDPAKVSHDALTRATTNVGYPSKVKAAL